MLILGIDTSCDDTSAAVLSFEGERADVLSNVVSNQDDVHTKYGGIVPELASRRHIEMISSVVDEALGDYALADMEAISVCMGPGLVGSLLVGCSFAKAAAFSLGKPLIGVNHLEGHLLSPALTGQHPNFPFLALVVSGGHTTLYKVVDYCKYTELGKSRDDAAGEAYDKVAKMLGLGYPGGPLIDKLATEGNPKAVALPRAYMPGTFDYSFSGLKTAVRLAIEKFPDTTPADMAASFQASVVDVLVRKMERAMKELNINTVTISGGVAANSAIRDAMTAMCAKRGASLFLPPMNLCTDNAAMIALAGYYRYRRGETAGLDMNPKAYMPLEEIL